MPILSKDEAKSILEKAIKYSKADQCEAALNGGTQGNIRYARNTVSTSGVTDDVSLVITSSFGKRSGTVTLNELTDSAIEKAVRRAEEIARLAPENPEFMEALPQQNYDNPKGFFESTANITPDYRAEVAKNSILPCKSKDATAAGFMEDNAGFQALMNSKGLFAYHQSTNVDFTITVRSNDGTGSGYALRDYNDTSKLDARMVSEIALKKAVDSRNPKAIEPGKYTVILEPAASNELLRNMLFNMAARNADEGRSFLSKKGGGTKVGEKMFDERVTIYSDPLNEEIPVSPFGGDGLARKKTMWVENGVVKNMFYSRFWAKQKGVEPITFPGAAIMVGGSATTEEMIKNTKKGILVTRLWYIRAVDPQTLLYTGLTRDGTFYIENGKILYPVKNFRFNESPVIMLNNIEALGKPERIGGSLIPPMMLRDFTFTSLSDAI